MVGTHLIAHDQYGNPFRIEVNIEIGPPQVHSAPRHEPVYHQPPRAERVREAPIAISSGSIQSHFRRLMSQGRMLQQSDARLWNRGLLIPNGGLCATTSAVNVLHAAFSHLGLDTTPFGAHGDNMVHRLVESARDQLDKDAREGLNFSSLATVVNDVANQLHSNVGVHTELEYGWHQDLSKLRGDGDTLVLLAVRTSNTSAHAIVVLGVDEQRGTFSYSDPNYPNEIRTQYIDRAGGEVSVSGFGDFGRVLDVLKIRTKEFDHQEQHRWSRFAGKRAWVIGEDGHRMITAIDQIDGPTPEFPSGRMVDYHHLLGSIAGGSRSLEGIENIVEIGPPKPETVAKLKRLAGKQVKIQFTESFTDDQYGDRTFKVIGVTNERHPKAHPFGGLKVTWEGSYSEYIIPFDSIAKTERV